MPSADFDTCSACGALIRLTAKFCEQCGNGRNASQQNPASAQRPRWYYNIWFVLAMLLFVLGPLGLPLVWKNPRFNRGIKYALTALMIVYTVGLIKLTVQMVRAVSQSVEQFNSTLHF